MICEDCLHDHPVEGPCVFDAAEELEFVNIADRMELDPNAYDVLYTNAVNQLEGQNYEIVDHTALLQAFCLFFEV